MEDMKNNLKILYEDNHIIVVIKPYNILSQGDSTKDLDMLSMIKKYIKEKYQKKSNVYLGLVHRLDRPTGGIMVFAKTSKAASRLSKEIKEQEIKKTYLAVVPNLKKEKGKFVDYLEKNNNNTSVISTKEKGKYAELNFETIAIKNNKSLVKINLITGRHHQIRIQFSSRGYPLYGDQRYGPKNKKQLALFAYEIEFIHPTTKEKMKFRQIPEYGIFQEFKELVK